jgi:hypothetical protein
VKEEEEAADMLTSLENAMHHRLCPVREEGSAGKGGNVMWSTNERMLTTGKFLHPPLTKEWKTKSIPDVIDPNEAQSVAD